LAFWFNFYGRLWASTDDLLGIGDVIESGDDQKDHDDSGKKERTRHWSAEGSKE
jgi:hypothetical protein